jgi:hypothetical protein
MYPAAHQVPDMSAVALREANQADRQDPSRPPRQISPRSSHSGTPLWPAISDGLAGRQRLPESWKPPPRWRPPGTNDVCFCPASST